jgi:hypothetical protein
MSARLAPHEWDTDAHRSAIFIAADKFWRAHDRDASQRYTKSCFEALQYLTLDAARRFLLKPRRLKTTGRLGDRPIDMPIALVVTALEAQGQPRICRHCHTLFTANTMGRHALYCRPACKQAHYHARMQQRAIETDGAR